MNKSLLLLALLSLSQTPVLAQSAALSPQQQQEVRRGGDALKDARFELEAFYLDEGLGNYQLCVSAIGPIVQANPALAGAPAPFIPGMGSGVRVQALLDECRAGAARLAPFANPAALPEARALLEGAARGTPEQCLKNTTTLLQRYPGLADVKTRMSPATIRELSARCQGDAKQNQAAQTQAAGKLVTLKQRFDNTMAALKKAQAGGERTPAELLKKYQALELNAELLSDLLSEVGSYDREDLRGGKIGNTGLTVGAFIGNVRAGVSSAQAAVKAIQGKADRAFEQQDQQIRATLPGLIGGDRLAIYRRQGIPGNWSGGPVFSKNGVYSGDGKAVARDLATATQWYYNDNGRGCDYKYYFSGNKVTRTEKPYGC